jgi:hypothetical protein
MLSVAEAKGWAAGRAQPLAQVRFAQTDHPRRTTRPAADRPFHASIPAPFRAKRSVEVELRTSALSVYSYVLHRARGADESGKLPRVSIEQEIERMNATSAVATSEGHAIAPRGPK